MGKEPLVVEVDLWLNSFENPVEKNNNNIKKNTQKPTFSVLDRRVPREKKIKVMEWKVIFTQSVTVLFSPVFIFFFSRWLFFLFVAESG